MNLREFAEQMNIDYTTAHRWAKKGLIPGAKVVTVAGNIRVWNVPASALSMKRPARGIKSHKGKKGRG